MGDRLDPALLEAELRARREHAQGPLERAVWCLPLGEAEDGLETIRRHLADVPEDAPPRRLAEAAVVVGDWERAAREARAALEDVDGHVAGFREYLAAMLCLIAEDEDEASRQAETLEGLAGTRDRLRSGHPAAVAAIPRGLLDRDADRVEAGVEALLAWHLRRARARSEIFNSSRGVVSLEAIVALLLAHRRGLSVPVAPTYRRAALPLLALHVTEWQGEPLPTGLKLTLEADLVAGAWLRSHGLALADPPPAARTARRSPRAHTRGPGDVDGKVAGQSLWLRERAGEGSAWQLASWALMLGDAERARAHLERAAAEAHTRWRETAPRQGAGLRWLWQSQALPNANYVREHFGLALVLEDEEAIAETAQLLDAWATARAEDQQRRGGKPFSEGRYGHVGGYLDLLSSLLGAGSYGPTRADAEEVRGPPSSARVACVGLVERDARLVSSALDDILHGHAQALERKSSPPPALSEPAAHLAVAARRLGIPVRVDESYGNHPVPVEIRNVPGHQGRLGRLPCDLLGRSLWER